MKFTCQCFPAARGLNAAGPYAVIVLVPDAPGPGVHAMLDRSARKHNSYLSFTISLPHKPRSTGPKSQSAHLHGHLQQIGRELGYSMEEIKDVMKQDCIEWPRKMITVKGRLSNPEYTKSYMVPVSESEVDTIVEASAVEWCHVRAAEFGIILVEE